MTRSDLERVLFMAATEWACLDQQDEVFDGPAAILRLAEESFADPKSPGYQQPDMAAIAAVARFTLSCPATRPVAIAHAFDYGGNIKGPKTVEIRRVDENANRYVTTRETKK